MLSRDHFQGKRIAMIGLGPHGEMVADAAFLIKAGALLSVYDLRSEARIKEHLLHLRTLGLANYVCGSIPEDDLLDMDLIVLSHEYPQDSGFLRGPKAKGTQIEYPETLFFKLAPPLTLVGVIGHSGKSTVVSMLAPLLEAACAAHQGQGFMVIDPESDAGILAHLKKARNGDIALMRIIGAMMGELRRLRISPHVAVFTALPEKGTYADSPFELLSYQTYNNFIVASDEIIDATRLYSSFQPKAKMLRTKASIIPDDWKLALRGPHDRDNAALALEVARLFKVSDDAAQAILERRAPLKGRLEPVKKVKGIEFYNDGASVTPQATATAIRSLAPRELPAEGKDGEKAAKKSVILIMGGAAAEAGIGGDHRELYAALPRYVRTLILLPGSGTLKERPALRALQGIEVLSAPSLEEAVRMSLELARKGDIVLFSPGFAAGGIDRSRAARAERFVRAVRAL